MNRSVSHEEVKFKGKDTTEVSFDFQRSSLSSLPSRLTIHCFSFPTMQPKFGVVESLSPSQTGMHCKLLRLFMDSDGFYPNNARFPVLVYKNAHRTSDPEK